MSPILDPPGPAEPPPLPQSGMDAPYRAQLDRVAQEKQAALAEPGLSWHDWLYFSAFKWWLAITLIVVDGWIVGYWIEVPNVYGLVASLALALYLEFVLYQYLWYRPEPRERAPKGGFRPSWHRPVEFGRWTPERRLAAEGHPAYDPSGGPDPREFL